ncbi:MAG TPA: hypothetical protein VN040_14100 [Pseudosphingobacterium sp.]|nr:hypothetical protein [Pseudosphingobacterium sp.]
MMRKPLLLLLSAIFLFSSCGKKEPSREEASKLIRKYYKYPQVFDYDISCGDETVARQLLSTDLEKDGWINIRKTIKMIDTGAFITFTEKAQPYLLPTDPEDLKYHRQNVKVMDIDMGEIISMETSKDGNHIMISYTVKQINKTPFIAVLRKQAKDIQEKRVYLARTDQGWMVDKQAEAHFIFQ